MNSQPNHQPTVIIVSAASDNHVASAKQLIASANLKDYPIIFFDIGLSKQNRYILDTQLKEGSAQSIIAQPNNPTETSTSILRNAGDYGWKPKCISKAKDLALGNFRYLIWLDAGNIILSSLERLIARIEREGVYSPTSSGTIADWTHIATLTKLAVNPALYGLPNRNGAILGFDIASDRALKFIQQWESWCDDKDLLAPLGSSRSNHRQDQSLFSIAYYLYLIENQISTYTTNTNGEEDGVVIHQDLDIFSSKDLYSRCKKFEGFDYPSGAYFRSLHRSPTPHPYRTAPQFYVATTHQIEPALTLVTSTTKEATLLSQTLPTWLNYALYPFDLIIINDASGASDLSALNELITRYSRSNMIRDFLFVKNDAPIFSTACSNLGYFLSRTEFIIEIPPDVYIEQHAFDVLLTAPLKPPGQYSAVSGIPGYPGSWWFDPKSYSGPVGDDTYANQRMRPAPNHNATKKLQQNSEHIGSETVSRGPIAFRSEDLRRYRFLDEQHFYRKNDHHELILRMRIVEDRLPAYVPIKLQILEHPTKSTYTSNLEAQVEQYLSTRKNSPFFETYGRYVSLRAHFESN